MVSRTADDEPSALATLDIARVFHKGWKVTIW